MVWGPHDRFTCFFGVISYHSRRVFVQLIRLSVWLLGGGDDLSCKINGPILNHLRLASWDMKNDPIFIASSHKSQ